MQIEGKNLYLASFLPYWLFATVNNWNHATFGNCRTVTHGQNGGMKSFEMMFNNTDSFSDVSIASFCCFALLCLFMFLFKQRFIRL